MERPEAFVEALEGALAASLSRSSPSHGASE
jgi:hypothetical protein